MGDSQNVQISRELFDDILSLFIFLSVSKRYQFPEIYKFDEIFSELKEKQHRINLRYHYTNSKCAKTEKDRNTSLNNYLTLKRKNMTYDWS